MQKHPDGSVTLSKDELTDLNQAYQGIMNYFAAMPFSMGDMFDDETYTSIRRWRAQLNGEEYIPEDDDDDDDDDDEAEEN